MSSPALVSTPVPEAVWASAPVLQNKAAPATATASATRTFCTRQKKPIAPAPLAGGLASHHRLKAATFLAGSRRNPAS